MRPFGQAASIERRYLDIIDSTNDEVRRLADAGHQGPLWVRAGEQTKGRGRRGRSWLSEPGNLFATGLYTLHSTPQEAANLSFVTALAVADTVASFVGSDKIGLKWPNDVLIVGRKCSGILLESWTSEQGLHLAIGVGINVVTTPSQVDQPITCVLDHLLPTSHDCSAATVFNLLIDNITHWLDVWSTDGFEPIRRAWLSRAVGLDSPIIVRLSSETIDGVFAGLAPDGALDLRLPDGKRRAIAAGDVYFPGLGSG